MLENSDRVAQLFKFPCFGSQGTTETVCNSVELHGIVSNSLVQSGTVERTIPGLGLGSTV